MGRVCVVSIIEVVHIRGRRAHRISFDACPQDSLAGNSKVLMFCNFSPASYNVGETLCTLNFAARCRAVELGQAKKGGESAELRKYKIMVQKLQDQLAGQGGGSSRAGASQSPGKGRR